MTGETPIKTNKTNNETEVDLSSAFSPEETADYLVFVSDSNQCVSALYFSFELE